MWSGLWSDGGGMVITAPGPVFPGRNNPTAKSTFASGKGMTWRCHWLFCVGDSGICRPGEDPGSLSQAPTPSLHWTPEVKKGQRLLSSLLSSQRLQATPPQPSSAPAQSSPPLPSPSCRTPKPTGSAASSFHNSYITTNVFVPFILCQTVF